MPPSSLPFFPVLSSSSISNHDRHQDRVLKWVHACDPITQWNLPGEAGFDYGMVIGVGMEILSVTLKKMVEIYDTVFVDIQSIIRVFDGVDGTFNLVLLNDNGFYHLLPRIGFLKATSEEALFMEVEEVRKKCCVVVSHGKERCELYLRDGEMMKILPFSANQVDPTGAGDNFLGGFVAGLVQGLLVPDATLLGKLFGSIIVCQIGLPKFDSKVVEYSIRIYMLESCGCLVKLLSSVCNPSVTVHKGYGLLKEIGEYLASHGFKNSIYFVSAGDIKEDLFRKLVLSPFQIR
ncbi:hypothetical protein Ddye_008332 [Dipteronia dyeriana]|uniref:Carbohydrate kinase PfkB domain-containing protein n=1 Tax=Dipteronia dyeriana TaxID=168575 RepID=A0AAD9X9L6_9ROSI|nr:hypothetical protein Ddye_008332 [Dipteronia dyeriana]